MKRLWHIMLAIAVIAGLLAAFGVVGATAILIVTSALALPLVLAKPGFRLSTAAWVASLTPLMFIASLYATWFAAWISLGHRPQTNIDDPKFINSVVSVAHDATFVLLLGSWYSLFLGIPLLMAFAGQSLVRDRIGPIKVMGKLLLLVVLWLAPFVVARSGLFALGYIFGWFMD